MCGWPDKCPPPQPSSCRVMPQGKKECPGVVPEALALISRATDVLQRARSHAGAWPPAPAPDTPAAPCTPVTLNHPWFPQLPREFQALVSPHLSTDEQLQSYWLYRRAKTYFKTRGNKIHTADQSGHTWPSTKSVLRHLLEQALPKGPLCASNGRGRPLPTPALQKYRSEERTAHSGAQCGKMKGPYPAPHVHFWKRSAQENMPLAFSQSIGLGIKQEDICLQSD